VLDPRIGYTTLEAVFKDQSDLLLDLKSAKKSLETEFNKNYTAPNVATASPANRTTAATDDSPKKGFFSRFRGSQASSNPQDELKRYFQMTAVPLPFDTTDLLGWWYTNRAAFPNLYKMARDIHCIPGMSFRPSFLFPQLTKMHQDLPLQ
jgi:hypothetical protein